MVVFRSHFIPQCFKVFGAKTFRSSLNLLGPSLNPENLNRTHFKTFYTAFKTLFVLLGVSKLKQKYATRNTNVKKKSKILNVPEI